MLTLRNAATIVSAMASAAASPLAIWTNTIAIAVPVIPNRRPPGLPVVTGWLLSIAAENRGMKEGVEMMMRLARDAGFDNVTKVTTDGHPGVFATLDAGAPRTIGLYFMYDVKQVDPTEWSSPPWDAAFVDKPGMGKAIVGRGAVNQKGPEAAFLAALHAGCESNE